jgi:DNA-binding NarL/FixJ family response regulator
VSMPVMDGFETTRKLRELYPQVKVVVLTMYDDEEFILRLVGSGAHSYLLKNLEPEELVKAVRTVVQKGSYFNERITAVLAKGLVRHKQEQEQTGVLSAREVEVVQLMAQEYTNQQIGEILQLSARTVEGHRKRIQSKIGARNMAGVLMYAVKNGLIE